MKSTIVITALLLCSLFTNGFANNTGLAAPQTVAGETMHPRHKGHFKRPAVSKHRVTFANAKLAIFGRRYSHITNTKRRLIRVKKARQRIDKNNCII